MLAVLLALCMIFTLLPAAVFAASEEGAAGIAKNPGGSGIDNLSDSAAIAGSIAGGGSQNGSDVAANDGSDTAVNGVTDISGGSGVRVDTMVRDNYTDCDVTDAINITAGRDYIIDFSKDDNLSLALRSMADLDKTKYYKFANSDNNSLVETENPDEALLKIVGHKDENKAVMTLVQSIDQDMSFYLNFMRTQYTGAKLTYMGMTEDENGNQIIHEIRDDYYTRYHFNCKLNLVAAAEVNPDPGNTDPGNTDQGKDSNAAGRTDAKAQKSDSAAKTGDDASPLLWAGILLLAAVSGGTAVLYRRKAKN